MQTIAGDWEWVPACELEPGDYIEPPGTSTGTYVTEVHREEGSFPIAKLALGGEVWALPGKMVWRRVPRGWR